MYVPTYVGIYVCMCREVQSWCWESSWITFYHIHLGRVFQSKPELARMSSFTSPWIQIAAFWGWNYRWVLDIYSGFLRSKLWPLSLHSKHFNDWVARSHVLHWESWHERFHSWLEMVTHLATTNSFRTCNNETLIEAQMLTEPQAFLAVLTHASLHAVPAAGLYRQHAFIALSMSGHQAKPQKPARNTSAQIWPSRAVNCRAFYCAYQTCLWI